MSRKNRSRVGRHCESHPCGVKVSDIGQKARERFGCRRENGRYVVPSEYVIRDCLVRIEPGALDRALNGWNQAWGAPDEALAMDGKTMKNALDEEGRQTHIMSVVGHKSKRSYAQKK